MATTPAPKTPAAKTVDKPTRAPISLLDRTKAQLSTATLKNKISAEELSALGDHITKLKSLLA